MILIESERDGNWTLSDFRLSFTDPFLSRGTRSNPMGENMDGVVEILEFINRIFVTNDIAFVSSDICLMLANRETSKRANKEIAGNAMKILLENDGTETYAKSTLESF